MAAVPRYNSSPDPDFSGQETIWMSKDELDGPMRQALAKALPPEATFGFNYEGERAWVTVSKPGDTRKVLEAARIALGRHHT